MTAATTASLGEPRTRRLAPELHRAVANLARTPRLLVACDYDGTLAPLVADPERARPLPESVNALRSLAGCPRPPAR